MSNNLEPIECDVCRGHGRMASGHECLYCGASGFAKCDRRECSALARIVADALALCAFHAAECLECLECLEVAS